MTKKRLSILACSNLGFHWFTIGIIIPVMTLFLMEKGFNLLQVGIAFAIYSTATVLLELPTGGLADSIGRKKVYLFAMALQIIVSISFVLINNYIGLLVCFGLQGAVRSLTTGTMDAHFVDEFYRIDPEVNLQKEMAKIGIAVPIGLGLGSLIGGFLPMTLGRFTEQTFLNSMYSSNYIIFTLTLIIQFAATFFLVKEDKKTGSDSTLSAGFKKVPEVLGTSVNYGLKHPVILLLLLAMFTWGFSISGLEQLWQPQVKGMISDSTGSWIYGVLTFGYFVAAGLGNILVTPICKLFKDDYVKVLFFARTIMGILYFILAIQSGIIMFSIFYITLFMFNGVQGSPESAIFNDQVPSEKRSTLLSFSSLFLQLGGILGSITMGFLAQTFSIKAAWIAASVVITSSALLYLFIPYFKDKRNKQENRISGLSNEF